jgi:predicted transcriptional regulator
MYFMEKVSKTIKSIKPSTFTVHDLQPYLSEHSLSAISSAICNLVTRGVVYRIGRTIKNKKSVVMYTTDKRRVPKKPQRVITTSATKQNPSIKKAHDSDNWRYEIMEKENQILKTNIKDLKEMLSAVLQSLPKKELSDMILYSLTKNLKDTEGPL